jgi:hypothetical protein
MAKGRITKRAVDAAKARNKDSYLWDRELAGFGLKVTPAGSKVYLVQYELGGRKRADAARYYRQAWGGDANGCPY